LAHDRESEAGAGPAARIFGAVEALEDVRQIGGREAGAVVAHGEDPVVQGEVDGAAGRAPIDRVVEQVRDGAVDPVRLAADDGGLEVGVDPDVDACAPLGPLHEDLDNAVDPDIVEHPSRLAPPGQLDDVADQGGQLVELVEDVGSQRGALVLRQPVGILDRLDVRSQAGDRRAQLVARVGDEVALRLDRALQRVERGVEAAGQARELVVARRFDPLDRIRTAGDLLGPAREPLDRGERRARDERTQPGREGDAGGRDDREHDEDVTEGVIDLGERARDLQRSVARRQRAREHAQVRVPDPRAGERLAGARERDRPRLRGHRQAGRRAFRTHDRAVAADDLRVALRPAEGGVVAIGGLSERALAIGSTAPVAIVIGQLMRARSQRVVDLPVKLRPDRDEDRTRGDHHGDRHRDPGDGGDPVAQRHGSRRM
jgi:hypothetical protein